MKTGRVALVGAGPGDPSLLTLRAAELLRIADVVAYDELVSESILALVPATAELLPVGRRAGKGHLAYALHPDVLERAKRGLFVVRLKAGDPLIFGRGGEEAAELAEHGIAFELVPGISAALGAASYGAIPLTYRHRAAQLVISTGHRADGGAPPPDAPGGRTLALYMAAHELETNLASLVAAGWPPSTPAALVVAATTAEEQMLIGTLATLAARAERALAGSAKLPALVVVGDVVGIRDEIDWRRDLPLRGRRILVARASARENGLARSLRTLGGDVIELPHPSGSDGTHVAPARWPLRVDLVVLPSREAARALYAAAPLHVRQAAAVAMGPDALDEAHLQAVSRVVAAEHETIESLVDAAVWAVAAPALGPTQEHASPLSPEITP